MEVEEEAVRMIKMLSCQNYCKPMKLTSRGTTSSPLLTSSKQHHSRQRYDMLR